MKEKSYGHWDSPFTADMVAQGSKRLGLVALDGDDIYWEESRPLQGGRSVVVKVSKDGSFKEITPAGYNVRNRVHEYGGASFAVKNGTIYFVNDKDQVIYKQQDDVVTPLTRKGIRYADLIWTPKGLIAIAEEHLDSQVENYLAFVEFENGKSHKLASGYDFYSSPAISKDGKKLAWLSWNHPNMPWDETELWLSDLDNMNLAHPKKLTGGNGESIFQPSWGNDGQLYWVSDKNGWWNLYRGGENIFPMEGEFASAQWVFGLSTYAFTKDKILCTFNQKGIWSLALFDPKKGDWKELDLPGSYYGQIRANDHLAAFIMGGPTQKASVISLNLSDLSWKTISQSEELTIPENFISSGQPISFPVKGKRTSHGFYYPPTNPHFHASKGELPPLLVISHGGPTGAVNNVLDYKIQYWTSRGFAVLSVNYGGSTGYGRKYRELLNGTWGIVDVEDCEAGADYLVQKRLADPKKIAITGGSAGGYTTLCALTFGKHFTVGASHFGVSDLIAMALDTHKAESRYLDRLIGPLPQDKEIYLARSPLQHVDRLKTPVIFFQGEEDKIVPPNQSEMMYQALKKKGIQTELILYPEEQHGFRKAENIKDSLEKELAFYLEVFAKK